MSEQGLDQEIAILEWRKMAARKQKIQDEEWDELPKLIYVSYVGVDQQFMHTGRSRAAKKNPFHFQKGTPIAMNQPADIKYFINEKSGNFEVEKMDETAIAQKTADEATAKAELLQAEAEAKKNLEKETKKILDQKKKDDAAAKKQAIKDAAEAENERQKKAAKERKQTVVDNQSKSEPEANPNESEGAGDV